MAQAKRKPAPSDVAVAAGNTFRVPRAGKPARHVRIVRVQRAANQSPCAYYIQITRSGNRKPGDPIRHVLTFRDGAWRMSSFFEAVEL
jgi:hypothetical protein